MRIAEGKLWKCFMQKGNRRSKAGKPASEAKGEFSFLNHTGRKTQSLNKFPRLPAYLPINCGISNLAIHLSILVNLSSISNPTTTYPSMQSTQPSVQPISTRSSIHLSANFHLIRTSLLNPLIISQIRYLHFHLSDTISKTNIRKRCILSSRHGHTALLKQFAANSR